MNMDFPTLNQIKENQKRISPWILQTPVWHYRGEKIQELVGNKTEIFFKLELLQKTGTFKPRGALTTIMHLDKDSLAQGVVAASAGNHAVGVSYAAKVIGTSARVLMPYSASKIKMERCRQYGAEIVLVETMAVALTKMEEIAKAEGRMPIHPFEGPMIALGTGTVGLELMDQISDLQAVIVPVGGGGLVGGIANAIKQMSPHCQIFGVEPEGADAMYRSFQIDGPVRLQQIETIAESLATPLTLPYSYALCKKNVERIVRVSDDDMVKMMQLLFYEMKLAVEPAAAASLAALCGPLKRQLEGKRVALILSGTNIDQIRYCDLCEDTEQQYSDASS